MSKLLKEKVFVQLYLLNFLDYIFGKINKKFIEIDNYMKNKHLQ